MLGLRLTLTIALIPALAAGCTEQAEPVAGHETGPCVEGVCLEGLSCLSEVCVEDDSDTFETSGPATATTGPTTTTGTGGATTDGDPTGATEGDAGGDTSSGATGDPSWGTCDQLDILFVVDNSGSMLDEQGALIESAPDFLARIVERSGSDDHHVMVVDTDAWVFGGCDQLCQLTQACLWEDYVCGETQPMQCEDVLGAGVVHPRGNDAANAACGFSAGERFARLSAPDAMNMVSCAATVGTGSTIHPETPMAAMVTAINPVADSEALDCNEGFLRDGAPLVVVFVTDEDDGMGDSPGTPEGWAAGLATAKGGDATRIAVLGLFGDTGEPGASCAPLDDENNGAEASPRLIEFVELFGERGVRGSVCAPSYDESFGALLGVLDAMCE